MRRFIWRGNGMRKKGIGLLAALSLLTVTACGRSEGTAARVSAELQDVKNAAAETVTHVTDSIVQDEKNLVIDADVELGAWEKLSEITIRVDEEAVQKFINRQIVSEYPEIEESRDENGSRKWNYERDGQILMSCTLEDNGGLYYVDVRKDRNCMYLDAGEHILEYGYITELEAPGVGLTAVEAAEEVARYLKEYSPFDFRAWNILAEDRPAEGDKSGYYSVSMQPVYGGIPVSVKNDPETPGLSTTAAYSSEGIFQFQGAFLFSVSEGKEIEKMVPFSAVLDKFKSEFAVFAGGNHIAVNRITFEYFPQMDKSGSYTLSPVWSFYCTDTRTEVIDDAEKEITLRYSCMYFAEDGELCGVYY